MSYLSAIRNGDKVLVWERDKDGRELKTYDAPFYFYVDDPNGEHTTMYGNKVTRYEFEDWKEFTLTKKACLEKKMTIYESDIPPDLKVLSEKYYNAVPPTMHVTFLDIEVDYDETIGFSSATNPYAPINSVALYHSHLKKFVILVVAPEGHNIPNGDASDEFLADMAKSDALPENLEVFFCRDEKELLKRLIEHIQDSDLIAGWNSDFFDIPYVAMRVLKVLDGIDFDTNIESVIDAQKDGTFRTAKHFQRLDYKEAGRPQWRVVEKFKMEHLVLDTRGRIYTDYLDLFKKYEVVERRSYKLESIADEVLPEMPKLEYEGSLAKLYRNDLAKFVRYNLRDTEILLGFEDRLGYVGVANTMCHLSTGLFKHVTGTLKLAELATINYCHHELGGIIVNDNSVPEVDGRIEGAIVLLPQVGMHENIGSIDITSLYPSAIRSINISPETLVGQFKEKIQACKEIALGSDVELTLVQDSGAPDITVTASEWRDILTEAKYAVSGYGTVFNQEKEGIIPSILAVWFKTRKDYQRQMHEAHAAGDEEKAAYCNRLQYVYKIKLNSFYGALNNKHFRFYDLRMGESTTGTGRMILLHQCSKVTEILGGEYAQTDREVTEISKRTGELVTHVGYSEKWSVVYGDTDSTYFATRADNPDEAIVVADHIGVLCNESFPEFMRANFLCGEGYDQIIKTGREIVSDRGIFVKKKRYILHIIDNEGEKVDKIKVMGLDTKKTTLSKAVSDKLNGFVERLLKGEDWDPIAEDIVAYKEFINTTDDIQYIGLPKGVKGVESYTAKLEADTTTRVPGHVMAAIHYNLALEKYHDTESPRISSGMKIRVYYITQHIGKFKSIAIPVDIETVPSWFEKHYEVNRKMHVERLVDKPLGNIIEAIGKPVPSRQSLFVDDVLVF